MIDPHESDRPEPRITASLSSSVYERVEFVREVVRATDIPDDVRSIVLSKLETENLIDDAVASYVDGILESYLGLPES